MSAPRPSLRALLALALPLVMARATQAVITACDAAFAAPLGSDQLTAVTTGGLNCFFFIILPMGTVFIVQSYAAQLKGKGDLAGTRRYAFYGLLIATASGLFALAAMPLIGPVLHIPYDGILHKMMTDYMIIRLTSVAAVVGTEALGAWYGGLGNTWMQMIAGVVAMVANVILAWALIYGHLGAPAMGVSGAALASTLASWLGFAVIGIAFWRGWAMPAGGRAGPRPEAEPSEGTPRSSAPDGGLGSPPGKRARTPLRLSRAELGRVVRFGVPNGVNWFLEFAAFQLFLNGVMPDLGKVALSSLMVVMAINSVAFMPAFGLASSGAVLAGQAIGAGDKDAVWPHVRLTLIVTATWMVAVALAYLAAPRTILGWFAPPDHHDELIEMGRTMLIVASCWQIFDAIAMTLTETLRAAGDTTWSAAARLILAWVIFVPTAFVAVRVLGGGPGAAMACLVMYLAMLAFVLAYRFKSGAWRRIELIEPTLA
jgi:MATE family multidrug resistance protein